MDERESVDERERAKALAPLALIIDPVDRVRGLASLDVLRERVDLARLERLPRLVTHPRNAAERHLMEHGHVLAYGCCRTRETAPDRAAAA